MHRARRWALAMAALMVLSVAFAAPAAAHGSKPHVKVLASGLDNPRGISVDGKGRVLVAIAGRGGPTDGFGTSGKILRITGNIVRTLRSGLPSAISPEGEVTGPVNVTVGYGGKPVAVVGGGPQNVDPRFDSLLKVWKGHDKILANVQAFRNTHPDPTDLDQPPNPTDSNAYGLAVLKHGKKLVTDAAGNDLLLVKADGRIRSVAKFPNEVVSTAHLGDPSLPAELPAEAVPTSVAVGPDGYWYVGELKGFPFTPGTSRIWRVAPWARNVTCDPAVKTRACSLYADGFTSIIDLQFGKRGDLYVLEIAKAGVLNLFIPGGDTTGALWRVRKGVKTEIVPGRLDAPGGVAVARDGTIYVTNKSTTVGGGEVLRIRR
jgi:hypothetical protein